ncbi:MULTISPECIES: YisL family protein [Bacillus]|uniref:UPF0344 protein BA_1155/GBAA_1155/BAS1072 n=16 Tax=Bacillus cereus group TaxID=86661 RepID=Y1155_BACAN|nr:MULTISPECIES: YisL family protein [Bacillus]B7JDV6.1 RecName: Full=UPF0344 protein BCAH820_1232 [Bacillus cereus AH820]C3LBW9.1 RecName: Full=UPF0344 protein BAMEG_3427 [Bacillus anthracis str. CDC 684]C3P3K4.1 RecName: Full=UPF0344 protein BAA_1237 [Bacillus anthracis str. A0248]Q6HM31.1 RecName: Full=UPF0344 protein BT9727_1053 [[Bacillus thuringiensis] serovar konkukian str. 97-27]Q81TV2.1 RecName: Full=UPF0344 protein BA_1155/GBAA_1155/BAS1072 [Bacillus anthracis]AFU11792.1 YisL [Bacil
MVHMHITAWALGLILFFVAYSLYSAGRKGKGVHMGLRLMYIIIIVTGFMLYMGIMKTATSNMHMWYGLKMIAGILVIGGMEMVLVKMSKNKATGAVWGLFIVALVAVFYLGLKLPIGWQVF